MSIFSLICKSLQKLIEASLLLSIVSLNNSSSPNSNFSSQKLMFLTSFSISISYLPKTTSFHHFNLVLRSFNLSFNTKSPLPSTTKLLHSFSIKGKQESKENHSLLNLNGLGPQFTLSTTNQIGQ